MQILSNNFAPSLRTYRQKLLDSYRKEIDNLSVFVCKGFFKKLDDKEVRNAARRYVWCRIIVCTIASKRSQADTISINLKAIIRSMYCTYIHIHITFLCFVFFRQTKVARLTSITGRKPTVLRRYSVFLVVYLFCQESWRFLLTGFHGIFEHDKLLVIAALIRSNSEIPHSTYAIVITATASACFYPWFCLTRFLFSHGTASGDSLTGREYLQSIRSVPLTGVHI